MAPARALAWVKQWLVLGSLIQANPTDIRTVDFSLRGTHAGGSATSNVQYPINELKIHDSKECLPPVSARRHRANDHRHDTHLSHHRDACTSPSGMLACRHGSLSHLTLFQRCYFQTNRATRNEAVKMETNDSLLFTLLDKCPRSRTGSYQSWRARIRLAV